MKRPDIDRPSTWKPYKNNMCNGCFGGCCTMPVEIRLSDLIRLGVTDEDEAAGSIKKLAKRLIKEGILTSYRAGTEFFMLSQKANRDCYYLDSKTRLCTVYEKRPDTCRQFPSIGPRPGFCPGTSASSVLK
ncbi:YkgJ family cysteine cluster protein [Bdellovibrio reynosensis]|uniref:YkgJ family cysteine cluster protein n=1 Tax=Bdellovibrio reynosensis TaxID=2835041 RepID=A0ABY4CAR0_9BACT|nr:YkgJ family cysteine cluster protein [Bdellovibrio reynosensis]UOF00977.1 YkgJ family cysteine cluster protein [Bdellovibrio reynosensis]